METASPIIYPQSGVLVFRRVSRQPEILLITTRKGHWTIPKGLVEPELGAAASAANEAFEEAGVRGRLAPESIGGFEYPKWGGVCRVAVFLLEATELADRWPEDGFRRRRWLQLPEAAAAVKFPLLADLIRRAEAIIRALPAAGEAVPRP